MFEHRWKYFGENSAQRFIGVGDTLGWLLLQYASAGEAYRAEVIGQANPDVLNALNARKQMCKELVELFTAEHDIK